MRILYVANSNVKSGASVALVNVIKGAIAQRYEVKVLTDSRNGYLTNELDVLGIEYYQCPMALKIYPKSRNPIRWLYKFVCLVNIWRKSKIFAGKIIKNLSPDIVHTNVGPLDVASDVCKSLGIPHVWHCREYQDLDFRMHYFPFQKKFRRLIGDSNNHCIAITKAIFDYWQLNENKDIVIYDGVFSINCLPTAKAEKKKYFLFVGRIEAAKGPLMLLNVFEKFVAQYPEYALLLAGAYNEDNPYFKRCAHHVANSPVLKECVMFLGNRNDVYQLMAKATALIVSSDFEGFGFISAEAMLNNCLVIGRNTAGTKEQFDNGCRLTKDEIGLRFSNQQELLCAMKKAVSGNFAEMKKNARKTVCQLYSIEKNVAELFNFYNHILKSKASNG